MIEPTPFTEFLAFLLVAGWVVCPIAFVYFVWCGLKALFGKVDDEDE